MFWKIVGLGVLAVLAFDTVASFASVGFGFPYEYAAVGSVQRLAFSAQRWFDASPLADAPAEGDARKSGRRETSR